MWNIIKIWENKVWINPIDLYGWFQWYFRYWLGWRSLDDEIKISLWKGIVSRFKGILIKMIKDANHRLMIILFHLKLERFYSTGIMNWLKKIYYVFFFQMKLGYYWFDRQ